MENAEIRWADGKVGEEFIPNDDPACGFDGRLCLEPPWKRWLNFKSVYTACLDNADTVETSNSFTSRPDVCQCLVEQLPIDNMSKEISQAHDPRSLRIKATFSCEVMDIWSNPWPGN